MAIISRGFAARRSAAESKLPPGQYLTTDFPVLSAGPTPRISLDRWEFTIDVIRSICAQGSPAEDWYKAELVIDREQAPGQESENSLETAQRANSTTVEEPSKGAQPRQR